MIPPSYKTEPYAVVIRSNEAKLRAQSAAFFEALSRLDRLPVNPETTALFQRYLDGELTIPDLNAALDGYLRRHA